MQASSLVQYFPDIYTWVIGLCKWTGYGYDNLVIGNDSITKRIAPDNELYK